MKLTALSRLWARGVILAFLFTLTTGNFTLGASIEDYVKNYREPADPPWLAVGPTLKEFYAKRGYLTAWDRTKAKALIEAVSEADKDGLDPQLYGLKEANSIIESTETETFSPRADIFFTEIFLRYALHLSQGRLDPEKFYPEWRSYKREVNLIDALNQAIETGKVAKVLNELAPQHPSYLRMKAELATLKKMASAGVKTTSLFDTLIAYGDLTVDSLDSLENPTIRPKQLKEALRRFQWRHGLPPTGRLNQATQKALRIPLKEKIEQLEINMERWRWLPDDFGSRYILTILPDLTLYVIDGGYTVLSMKTIIGTRKQPSPIFSGELAYIELNPTWNIPNSIVVKEIIPKVLKEPDYLQKKRIRIFRDWSESAPEISPRNIKWHRINPEKFPYRLTQDPGVNPLGRIKFIFPNEFDVYLHDTTERHLFNRERRLYSHGCIRIEKPLELALWLLKDTEFGSLERLRKEIRTRKRQKIELPQPISVYIIYLTCWVDGNGILHFRPDYYEYDDLMKKALKTLRPSSPPPEISAP